LSPRLLVFSEQEAFWHCQAIQFKTAKDGYLEYFSERKRLPDWVFTDSFRGNTPKQRRDLWADIVTNFTRRQLTDNEDRLNAIAGVAAELGRHWKDNYFFGHWEQLFVELLLWKLFDSPSTKKRSSRAPTWSWASLDCPVYFHTMHKMWATAEVTHNGNGHPRAVLKCRVRTLEDVARAKATDGSAIVGDFWDLDVHKSSAPPGAVLLLLGSGVPRLGKTKAIGIIGLSANDTSSGGLQRVGSFCIVMGFVRGNLAKIVGRCRAAASSPRIASIFSRLSSKTAAEITYLPLVAGHSLPPARGDNGNPPSLLAHLRGSCLALFRFVAPHTKSTPLSPSWVYLVLLQRSYLEDGCSVACRSR
jgi:hypothetical protein